MGLSEEEKVVKRQKAEANKGQRETYKCNHPGKRAAASSRKYMKVNAKKYNDSRPSLTGNCANT